MMQTNERLARQLNAEYRRAICAAADAIPLPGHRRYSAKVAKVAAR